MSAMQQFKLKIATLRTQPCNTSNSTLQHFELNLATLRTQPCNTSNSTLQHFELNLATLRTQPCNNSNSTMQKFKLNIATIRKFNNVATIQHRNSFKTQPCNNSFSNAKIQHCNHNNNNNKSDNATTTTTTTTFCRLCEEEVESAEHLWLNCPAFARARFCHNIGTSYDELVRLPQPALAHLRTILRRLR